MTPKVLWVLPLPLQCRIHESMLWSAQFRSPLALCIAPDNLILDTICCPSNHEPVHLPVKKQGCRPKRLPFLSIHSHSLTLNGPLFSLFEVHFLEGDLIDTSSNLSFDPACERVKRALVHFQVFRTRVFRERLSVYFQLVCLQQLPIWLPAQVIGQ